MKVYVDSESKIRDVGSTSDIALTELTINDEDNPFEGWSKAKICCYKITVVDGVVTMMTPYIDSRNLEMIDSLGKQLDSTQENVESVSEVTDSVMTETIPSLMDSNEQLQATIDMIMTDIIPNIIDTSTEER